MNVCVPATLIQFVDQENEPNMKIIYGILLPILSVIVLLSNGVKRATVEPLFWMAVSALLMAAAPLPFTIYYYNLDHMRDLNQTEFLCYLQKVCMEILPFFFNTLITFFTLLLGTQRFIAVQYPLDSLRWCSRRLIRRYSKAILTLAIVLTLIHSTFDIRVIYHFCIRTSDAPKLSVNRHKRVSSAFRNTTVMLTVIIVLFLLARVPSTVLIILVKLSDVLPLGSLEFAHSAYLRAFANIILITLHPISFAVYIRFRVSLRRLLGWRFLASDEEFNAVTSSARTSQFKSPNSKYNMLPMNNFDSDRSQRCSKLSSLPRKGVVFAPSPSPITTSQPLAQKTLSEWSSKSSVSSRFAFLRRFRIMKRCDTV
ncbi:unnamed protein product [Nippostrongylus brasiliensis]|uniref:G_PROTEIN_RECEP_F1_2 domain-containing protein n=1 Tax=Nippostrongylus brasiliensis TaxID=27835 RepID=A0A158QY42_NIPBR|nr:unnamed protein product [Nippostrongylus brasiliensis]